jgi:F0F1-type ATP synthase membrane subunit b/b'
MSDSQLTLILSIVGTLVAAVGVTFVVMRMMYGNKLGEMAARLDKVEKSRTRTNEMLLQARRQTETLQKELVQARRGSRPAAPEAKTAAAPKESGRNEAQLQALRRAKELMDEGDKRAAESEAASGFALTQPLSGFGPPVR